VFEACQKKIVLKKNRSSVCGFLLSLNLRAFLVFWKSLCLFIYLFFKKKKKEEKKKKNK